MKRRKRIAASWAKGGEWTLRVLNGVIGDTLEERKSPLAVRMRLCPAEGPQVVTDTGRICILAHGSCGSEKGWGFDGHPSIHYGSLLQKDFGYTPFLLRYNSGLHISTNGKRLSGLLDKFVRHYPKKVREVILVGHSMGGLVFRSACHYGQKDKRKWVGLVRKIFYLGSPHSGTFFENLGKLTTTILDKIPNPVTKLIATVGDWRSAGIKDLRHGFLTDEDWQKENSDKLFYRHQNNTPLLKTADHYLICGTLSKVAGSKLGRLFGDGMVHPASGTGRGWLASGAIPFLEEHCKIIPGISHPHLQRSRRVYAQIRNWCMEDRSGPETDLIA